MKRLYEILVKRINVSEKGSKSHTGKVENERSLESPR
jgi:hypothetical protein